MDILIGLWSQMTFKDLTDILLVAVLIYQGLLIVHGTRAVQMLGGIGVLLVLFWIGHSFELYSLNWILDHFFDSFFIIAIILFQDQFRSALASFGRGRTLSQIFWKEINEPEIDEVVEACGALSRERIGALIVFEKNQGLLNYIHSGTALKSQLHSDIIYAIFQSNSSLHDGAIILSDDVIAAAGCFLPLSKNVVIDRHMGTRHRAALGITEESDAIAVIVSEETGKINVCYSGVFYFCESPKQLRHYLKHLWGEEKLEEGLRPIETKDEV